MAMPVEAVDTGSRFEPSARGSGRGPRAPLWQLACFLVVLAGWSVVCGLHLVSAEALPSPLSVLQALVELIPGPVFWPAVGNTLRGAMVGLGFAIAVGVPLGLVTGTYAAAERSSRLLVDFLRSFPIIALLPVFLLILGSTPQMKSTVVFIACLFPVFLQAQYGARAVSPMIAETIRGYRIPRLLRFVRVILPSATPSIMTGVRLAATTSVLVAIGVEILSTLPGLGHEITQEQQAGDSASAYAYIVVSGLLGYGINRGSEVVESLLLRWRPPAQAD